MRASVLLPASRLALGLGAWALPVPAARVLGLPGPEQAATSYLVRVFAVRDGVIGAAALFGAPDARRAAWRLAVACDACDALAGAIAVRAGAPKLVTGLTSLAAVGAVAQGLAVLAQGDF